jgi:hypothetical protein
MAFTALLDTPNGVTVSPCPAAGRVSRHPAAAARGLEPWPRLQTPPPPRTSPPARAPAAKRHLGIEELLVWTYRDQKAHRYLRREYDWFLWQSEQQGIEVAPTDHRPVHVDAAVVHAAVMEDVRQLRRKLRQRFVPDREQLQLRLNAAEERTGLVVHFAEIGDRPERSTAEPLPYPVEPSAAGRGEFCRATIDGERRDILLLTEEVILIEVEEWVPAGRKKMRRHLAQRSRFEVQYCPIEWRPTPEWVDMTNHIADSWEAAIAAVNNRLAGVELRSHVLVG